MANIFIISNSSALFMGQEIPIAIGKNGFCFSHHKHEGDGKTPLIDLRPTAFFYRPDRVRRIKTFLPTTALKQSDGWCDAPLDREYNQFVARPFRASSENLYRNDHCYDYILATDYNYPNATPHKGSAIFIHIMHDDNRPTAGCIAFRKNDFQRIIASLQKNDSFCMQIKL
jgi:L,D-peptidoglycan transpeptidase YkuD (ErfK/YbiS/YcfS/YnhG family)